MWAEPSGSELSQSTGVSICVRFNRGVPMHFVQEQVIERPVSEVFAFISDPENLPRWNYYVIGCMKLDTSPARVGSTDRLVRQPDPRIFIVTELKPNRSLLIPFRAPTPPLDLPF